MRILTASGDNTARLWDAATGEEIGLPFHDDEGVINAAFSPDGTRLVTGSAGPLHLWDIPVRLAEAPQWMPDLVAAISGYEAEPGGKLREVPRAERVERAKRLPDSGEDRVGWSRLLKAAGL
jgi:hypothetical protein